MGVRIFYIKVSCNMAHYMSNPEHLQRLRNIGFISNIFLTTVETFEKIYIKSILMLEN